MHAKCTTQCTTHDVMQNSILTMASHLAYHLGHSIHDGNRGKVAWIGELQRLGLSPILKILIECNYWEMGGHETRFIKEYQSIGQAEFNRSQGFPPQQKWIELAHTIQHTYFLIDEIIKKSEEIGNAQDTDRALTIYRSLERYRSKISQKIIKNHPEWSDLIRLYQNLYASSSKGD